MALDLLTWAFWIVWYSIKEQGLKSQSLDYKHRFYYDLTKWCSVWHDSFPNSFKISTKQTIVTNFQEHWTENVPNKSLCKII